MAAIILGFFVKFIGAIDLTLVSIQIIRLGLPLVLSPSNFACNALCEIWSTVILYRLHVQTIGVFAEYLRLAELL